jgi:hypothetical protein
VFHRGILGRSSGSLNPLPEIVHQPEYLLPGLEHFGDPFVE